MGLEKKHRHKISRAVFMEANMESRLLEILCCPITRRPLGRLGADVLARVNKAIAAGGVRNHGGVELHEALTEALITTEGDLVYPVQDGIPCLLEEDCINWAAFNH
jgi:uncharacterized protein YbaR (Trm112 family)